MKVHNEYLQIQPDTPTKEADGVLIATVGNEEVNTGTIVASEWSEEEFQLLKPGMRVFFDPSNRKEFKGFYFIKEGDVICQID